MAKHITGKTSYSLTHFFRSKCYSDRRIIQ